MGARVEGLIDRVPMVLMLVECRTEQGEKILGFYYGVAPCAEPFDPLLLFQDKPPALRDMPLRHFKISLGIGHSPP